jgi:hypothetical protein
VDPLVDETDQPYVFTNDDPLNEEDPAGLSWVSEGPEGNPSEYEAPGLASFESTVEAEADGGDAFARVLGSNPEYVNLAKETASKYFEIPPNIWSQLSDTEKWDANVKFLDRGIENGDSFRVVTKGGHIDPTSTTEREVNYLLDHGYEWNKSRTVLVPKHG